METYSDYVARTEPRMKLCPECDGKGIVYWSCCGDEVEKDAQLCPSCHEHIDGVEPDICDICHGEGYVEDDNRPDPDERHDERKVQEFIRWQQGKAMDY